MTTKMKIKKGDTVIVTTGTYKGVKGEVTRVIPADNKVVVTGVNLKSKHRKPTQTNAGGIEKIEAPIHVSNVAIADPKTGKPTRVGFKFEADGTKVRVAKKSGEALV